MHDLGIPMEEDRIIPNSNAEEKGNKKEQTANNLKSRMHYIVVWMKEEMIIRPLGTIQRWGHKQ
jgi:hypothetical protein